MHDIYFLKANKKLFKNLYPNKDFNAFCDSFDKNAVDISTVIRSLFESYVCKNISTDTDTEIDPEDQEYSEICLHFATNLLKLENLINLTA